MVDARAAANESTCEVCTEGAPRYTCPGCQQRTCSLACVKAHKAATGCTGKRKRGEYIALRDFTEQNLLQDYRFLEDVQHQQEAAARQLAGGPAPPSRDTGRPQLLPKHLHMLQRSAHMRGTHLQFMHPGMSRRKANSTRWCNKTRSILWHTEWKILPEGEVLSKPKVAEGKSIVEVLRQLLGLPQVPSQGYQPQLLSGVKPPSAMLPPPTASNARASPVSAHPQAATSTDVHVCAGSSGGALHGQHDPAKVISMTLNAQEGQQAGAGGPSLRTSGDGGVDMHEQQAPWETEIPAERTAAVPRVEHITPAAVHGTAVAAAHGPDNVSISSLAVDIPLRQQQEVDLHVPRPCGGHTLARTAVNEVRHSADAVVAQEASDLKAAVSGVAHSDAAGFGGNGQPTAGNSQEQMSTDSQPAMTGSARAVPGCAQVGALASQQYGTMQQPPRADSTTLGLVAKTPLPHSAKPKQGAATKAITAAMERCSALLEAGQLLVLMQAANTPANKPLYIRIRLDGTVTQALAGKLVVEYPSFLLIDQDGAAALNVVEVAAATRGPVPPPRPPPQPQQQQPSNQVQQPPQQQQQHGREAQLAQQQQQPHSDQA